MVRAHCPCSFAACGHLFHAQIEKEIAALGLFYYRKKAAVSGFFRALLLFFNQTYIYLSKTFYIFANQSLLFHC
jgi:hypothetical protein